jgi:hypothetical protein
MKNIVQQKDVVRTLFRRAPATEEARGPVSRSLESLLADLSESDRARILRAAELGMTPAEKRGADAVDGHAEDESEVDDGIRLKCTSCDHYLKPVPKGAGMKCDACSEWFTLCIQCMPDTQSYPRGAVWLCPDCR